MYTQRPVGSQFCAVTVTPIKNSLAVGTDGGGGVGAERCGAVVCCCPDLDARTSDAIPTPLASTPTIARAASSLRKVTWAG